jgi:hypothetical protein
MSAWAGEELFVTFSAMNYRVASAVPGDVGPETYLMPGDEFEGVGTVLQFGQLLSPWTDPAYEAYTVHLTGFHVESRTFESGVLTVRFAAGARIHLYADSANAAGPATPAPNPPNTLVPSSYTDLDGSGWKVIGGAVDRLYMVFDFNRGSGWLNACVAFDEGPYLGQFVPPAQRADWFFHADLSPAAGPSGYDLAMSTTVYRQFDGWCSNFPPVSTRGSTWGSLKLLYR